MGQGVVSGERTHLNGFFLLPGSYLVNFRGPQALPNPPQSVAGIFFREASKTLVTSRIDERLDLMGHLEELAKKHTFNTLDPCVLDDDAIFLLVDDVTELDTQRNLHEIGPLPKDVNNKDVVTREALETNGNPFFTCDDVKVCYPLESPR